jgi:hypothetical protein
MWDAPCDIGVDDSGKSDFLLFDGELREALTRRDPVAMSFLAKLPLQVNYSDGSAIAIRNAATLQSHFAEIFPAAVVTAIIERKDGGPTCMHDGVMYARGGVWVGLVGEGEGRRFRVTTVNVPATKAVSQTSQIDFVCDAAKHRVVIDSVGRDKPRYRAWNKPRPTSGAPDLEIKDGNLQVEGTYPCTRSIWTFRKGRASFEVDSLGCTDGTPPKGALGELTVSAGAKATQHWWCY